MMLALIAAVAAGAFPTISLSLNVPEGGGEAEFLTAIREQIRMGVNGSYASFTWPELEPAPGQFNKAKLDETTGIGKFIGGNQLVTIKTVDTVKPVLPADLATKPFVDAELQARFAAFVDRLVPALPKFVKYLSLGNEVDGYFADKPEAQAEFAKMVASARLAAAKVRPDLHVGMTLTYTGMTANPAQAKTLLEGSDALILTYYPLDKSYQPASADQIPAQIKSILTLAETRDVVFQEVGYPSSAAVGSSDAKQSAFISAAFGEFRRQSQIKFANYYIQGDFTPTQMGYFTQYYGSSDAKFVGFLSSLGLRDAAGKPKPALATFRDEVKKTVPDQ
jgi:hypothetical protein